MNLKLVGRYLGYLLLAEGIFMLPPALVGAIYRETGHALSFVAAAGLCAAAGGGLYLLCRKSKGAIYAREGFVVAGVGWIALSLFGAAPFVLSGEIPHYMDALFETVSGFTTTGATVITKVEDMARSSLFWRSFTQWLGGVGVLAFLLAVVRGQKNGGSALHLIRAETTGPSVQKMMPRV